MVSVPLAGPCTVTDAGTGISPCVRVIVLHWECV